MVSLKVNNEFVDIEGDNNIAITLQSNDVGDISTRNGSYSTSINLPKTNHNISLFGYIDNLGVVSLSNPSKRYSAELYNKGAFFKSGVVKVNSVSKEDINITFYGDNVSWFDLIKDKKLNELDLSEFNHNWTAETVEDSWDESWTWRDGYTYPIIDYDGTIFDNVVDKNVDLPLENFRIAVYVKQLILKIADSIGYSLTGSVWERDVVLNNLILPFTGQEYSSPPPVYQDNSQDYNTEYNIKELAAPAPASGEADAIDLVYFVNQDTYWDYESNSMISADIVFLSFNLDIGIYGGFDPDYFDGWQSFNLVQDGGGGTIIFNHEVLRNPLGNAISLTGGDIIVLKGGLYDGQVYTVVSGTTTATTVTGTFLGDSNGLISNNTIERPWRFARPWIKVNGGVKVYDGTPQALLPNDAVTFGIDNLNPNSSISSFGQYEALKAIIEPDYEASVGGGVNINIALPNMTQGKLLNNILFKLGAVVNTDDQKKQISIDYFDDVINNIPNAKNWSKKVDKSKKYTLDYSKYISKYGKKNDIYYKDDDKDVIVIDYQNNTNIKIGSGQIVIDNDFLAEEKTLFTSEFSPTVNKDYEEYYVPLIKTSDGGLAPKLLNSRNGLTISQLSNGFLDSVTIDGGSAIENVGAAWFRPNPYLNRLGLASLGFQDTNGLLAIYFNTLQAVLDEGSLVRENILLDDNDIRELDFLTPIRLDQYQAYFYINKINQYKADNTSTVVELIKIA